jgi:hypothetical protein
MPIGDIFVEKCKAAQFFSSSSLPKIREVVSVVHDITSTATLFIKHFYLNVIYEDWLSDVGQAPARDVVKLDAAFIGQVFALVKKATIQRRGDNEERPAMMDRMTRLYRSTAYFASDYISNSERYNEHSLGGLCPPGALCATSPTRWFTALNSSRPPTQTTLSSTFGLRQALRRV